VKQFTVTDDHLKLIQHAYTSWDHCEFGAPEIDPKRPYGDTWVHFSMIKILGADYLAEKLGVPVSDKGDGGENDQTGTIPQ
jgi:hypothetical protein